MSVIAVMLFVSYSTAQNNAQSREHPKWKYAADSSSDAEGHNIGIGHISVNARHFFMATDNFGQRKDYYANSVGMRVRYQSVNVWKLRLSIGASVAGRLWTSDLCNSDSVKTLYGRYEPGLFDITDPCNRKPLLRLDELNIAFRWKNTNIVAGNQVIRTPFINPQDGRMMTTAVQGVTMSMGNVQTAQIEAGYLIAVSPRSTVKWYTAANSIGLYPTGVNTDGSKSDYAGNISGRGIFYTGLSHAVTKKLRIRLFDQYVDKVFNTLLFQSDYSRSFGKEGTLSVAFQYIRQDRIANGGNLSDAKTYFPKGNTANVFGVQLKYAHNSTLVSLNLTRIANTGRFLMPREWGREPLFTFLPRERNEGLGGVFAISASAEKQYRLFTLAIAPGVYLLPPATEPGLNKYGMPSYFQLNADAGFIYPSSTRNMNTHLLIAFKKNVGSQHLPSSVIANKVDMLSWNLVTNIKI